MAHEDILWPNPTSLEWAQLLKKGFFGSDWLGTVIAKIPSLRKSEITRGSRGNSDNLREALSSYIRNDALQFVLGPHFEHLASLITVFLKMTSEVRFPLSPLVSRKLTGASTPPLNADGLCFTNPFNVAPEWIRQNLNAWHNEDIHRKETGQKYFPFKYRDHLIHPVTTWLIGKLLLENYYMPPPAFDALCKVVAKDPNLCEIKQYLADDIPLCETIAMIWQQKEANDGNGSGGEVSNLISKDVLLAWQDVALWHDAGYDSLFWCLVNAAEFSHCRIYNPHVVTEKIRDCCKTLRTSFPLADTKYELQSKLKEIVKIPKTFDPYHLIWKLDEWKKKDPDNKAWGRSHATLSAHEFLKQHREAKEPRSYHVTLPALAIAEHHEVFYQGDDKRQLATEFVRNPFGCVLRWADKLAVVPRLKMTWIPAGEVKEINYPHLAQTFNYKDFVHIRMVDGQLICTIEKDGKNAQGETIAAFLWGTVIK